MVDNILKWIFKCQLGLNRLQYFYFRRFIIPVNIAVAVGQAITTTKPFIRSGLSDDLTQAQVSLFIPDDPGTYNWNEYDLPGYTGKTKTDLRTQPIVLGPSKTWKNKTFINVIRDYMGHMGFVNENPTDYTDPAISGSIDKDGITKPLLHPTNPTQLLIFSEAGTHREKGEHKKMFQKVIMAAGEDYGTGENVYSKPMRNGTIRYPIGKTIIQAEHFYTKEDWDKKTRVGFNRRIPVVIFRETLSLLIYQDWYKRIGKLLQRNRDNAELIDRCYLNLEYIFKDIIYPRIENLKEGPKFSKAAKKYWPELGKKLNKEYLWWYLEKGIKKDIGKIYDEDIIFDVWATIFAIVEGSKYVEPRHLNLAFNIFAPLYEKSAEDYRWSHLDPVTQTIVEGEIKATLEPIPETNRPPRIPYDGIESLTDVIDYVVEKVGGASPDRVQMYFDNTSLRIVVSDDEMIFQLLEIAQEHYVKYVIFNKDKICWFDYFLEKFNSGDISIDIVDDSLLMTLSEIDAHKKKVPHTDSKRRIIPIKWKSKTKEKPNKTSKSNKSKPDENDVDLLHPVIDTDELDKCMNDL